MDKELLKSFIALAWFGRAMAVYCRLHGEVDILSKRSMEIITKEILKALEEKDE